MSVHTLSNHFFIFSCLFLHSVFPCRDRIVYKYLLLIFCVNDAILIFKKLIIPLPCHTVQSNGLMANKIQFQ